MSLEEPGPAFVVLPALSRCASNFQLVKYIQNRLATQLWWYRPRRQIFRVSYSALTLSHDGVGSIVIENSDCMTNISHHWSKDKSRLVWQ
ncbi:hypothetical protein HZ326_21822 [Fusarium oxysporum f. sp. albedinis]|nr:hypothetical protein HZ326_21822 [Fusarium oxysporum f. sp. albedinis]